MNIIINFHRQCEFAFHQFFIVSFFLAMLVLKFGLILEMSYPMFDDSQMYCNMTDTRDTVMFQTMFI